MRELIKEIAKEATVILSTHIMQEVNALCDRVLILKSGQLVLDEKLDKLQQSKHLVVETDCTDLQLIKQISGVNAIEVTNDSKLIAEISKQAFSRAISSDIRKAIIESGASLFSIYPQQRDLETVFNQINNEQHSIKESDKGVSDAA